MISCPLEAHLLDEFVFWSLPTYLDHRTALFTLLSALLGLASAQFRLILAHCDTSLFICVWTALHHHLRSNRFSGGSTSSTEGECSGQRAQDAGKFRHLVCKKGYEEKGRSDHDCCHSPFGAHDGNTCESVSTTVIFLILLFGRHLCTLEKKTKLACSASWVAENWPPVRTDVYKPSPRMQAPEMYSIVDTGRRFGYNCRAPQLHDSTGVLTVTDATIMK